LRGVDDEQAAKLHQQTQKQLDEAKEKLALLEEHNRELVMSAANYRMNWINESRRAEALEQYGFLDGFSDSQARWSSPSPVSRGVLLDVSWAGTGLK
jgi:hypothetical protein